jgi:hypothetical protein
MGFGRDLRAVPREMEYQGRRISFIGGALRTTVKTGNKFAQIMALSDGFHTFHLRSDNSGGSWTLVGLS